MKFGKVLVTGGTGMVGKAIIGQLNKLTEKLYHPTHQELDLRDQHAVFNYFELHQPEIVFHLAAIVGGIHANHSYPAKFIYDNTQMHCNVIHACHQYKVKKLLFPGSACSYPKLAEQPIKEDAFLNGEIEQTNLAYAVAKINGIVMAQSYAREYGLNVILPMPTNTYGVGDNFNEGFSHVIPGLMKRFTDAKNKKLNEVVLWGSGKPLREFIYVDDLAGAMIFLMQHYSSNDIINVGTMTEINILDLARAIADTVDYKGEINLDTSKPDGAPRKCLDSSRLFAMGWKPQVLLQDGLKRMYEYHFTSKSLNQKELVCEVI